MATYTAICVFENNNYNISLFNLEDIQSDMRCILDGLEKNTPIIIVKSLHIDINPSDPYQPSYSHNYSVINDNANTKLSDLLKLTKHILYKSSLLSSFNYADSEQRLHPFNLKKFIINRSKMMDINKNVDRFIFVIPADISLTNVDFSHTLGTRYKNSELISFLENTGLFENISLFKSPDGESTGYGKAEIVDPLEIFDLPLGKLKFNDVEFDFNI